MNLTKADIDELVKQPSVAVRMRITEKVCTGFNSARFTEKEMNVAVEIFRLLLKDTEMRVRRTLSEQLKDNYFVPRDVVMALTQDRAEVASPILQHSFVLSEDDILSIIKATSDAAKLTAIARRQTMSEEVSDALVYTGVEEVVRTVMHNPGATLSDDTYDYLLDEYRFDDSILSELVMRHGLPVTVAEKLFSIVSDQLKKQLTKKYRLTRRLASQTVEDARDVAMLRFLSRHMSVAEIHGLVEQMHRSKRLSPGVLIHALCLGDIIFFEAGLARRANISLHNARVLLMDPGARGFETFYAAATMPEEFCDAVRTLYLGAIEEAGHTQLAREDYAKRMITRIKRAGHDRTISNMPKLVAMLSHNLHHSHAIH